MPCVRCLIQVNLLMPFFIGHCSGGRTTRVTHLSVMLFREGIGLQPVLRHLVGTPLLSLRYLSFTGCSLSYFGMLWCMFVQCALFFTVGG